MALREIYGMGNLDPSYLGNSFKVKAVNNGLIQEVDSEAEVEAFGAAQESDVILYSFLPQRRDVELIVEEQGIVLFKYVPAAGDDDDYEAFEAAVVAAGETLTANEQYAYQRLIQRLKNHGIWEDLSQLYMFKGVSNLAKTIINVKDPTQKLAQVDAANPATHDVNDGVQFTGVGKCALAVPQSYPTFSLRDCSIQVGCTSIAAASKQYLFGWFNDKDNYTAISRNAATRWQYGVNSNYSYVSVNGDTFTGNYNFSIHPIAGRWYMKDGVTLEKPRNPFGEYRAEASGNISGQIYLGALNRAKGAEYFSQVSLSHFIIGANRNHDMTIMDEIIDAFFYEVANGTPHTFLTSDGLVDLYEIAGLVVGTDGFVRGDLDALGFSSAEKKTIRKKNTRTLAEKCYENSADPVVMKGRVEVWADEDEYFVRVPEGAKWHLKGTDPSTDVIAVFPRVNVANTGKRALFMSLLNNTVKFENLGIGSDTKPWRLETYLCNVDSVDRTKVTLTNTRVDELYVRDDIRFTAGTIRSGFLAGLSPGDLLFVAPETLRKSNYSDARAAVLTIAEVNVGGGYIRFETEIPSYIDEVYIGDYFWEDVTVAEAEDYGQNWLIGGDGDIDEDTGEIIPGLGLAIYTDITNQANADPATRYFINCDIRNANTGYHKSGGAVKVHLDGGTWHGCTVAYSIHNGDYGYDTRAIITNEFKCYDNGFRIIGCYNARIQDENTDFEDKSNFSKNRLGSGGYTHPNTICEVTGEAGKLIKWYDNPTGAHRQYSASGNKEVLPGGSSFYKYAYWEGNQEYNSFGSQAMPTTYEDCTWKNGNTLWGYQSVFRRCTFDGAKVANKPYNQPRPNLDADGNPAQHTLTFEDCTFSKSDFDQTWVREGDNLTITFRRCHFQLGPIDPPYTMWDWTFTSGITTNVIKSAATTKKIIFEECTFDYDAGSLTGKNVYLINAGGGKIADIVFKDCTALTDFSTGVSGAASYKLVTKTSSETFGTTNIEFEGTNDLQIEID